MDGLTAKGLKYVDDDGEEKIIPRANIQDGYKYTIEENQRKEHLMTLCLQRFGDKIDKLSIELMVDFWINHPEDMVKEMEKDEDYMGNFKSQ